MIKYKRGYKYILEEDYTISVDIPNCQIPGYVFVDNGTLTIRKGYAWDGASGPTIDTHNSMRASLVHDAVYQLFREQQLSVEYKSYADDLFHSMLLEDGMTWFRAWYWYKAVRLVGGIFVK